MVELHIGTVIQTGVEQAGLPFIHSNRVARSFLSLMYQEFSMAGNSWNIWALYSFNELMESMIRSIVELIKKRRTVF